MGAVGDLCPDTGTFFGAEPSVQEADEELVYVRAAARASTSVFWVRHVLFHLLLSRSRLRTGGRFCFVGVTSHVGVV
ncbi:Uncharacterised protein [Corynebacterium renale]|nr:Uncharacterised protein [Corynebacterium renale]